MSLLGRHLLVVESLWDDRAHISVICHLEEEGVPQTALTELSATALLITSIISELYLAILMLQKVSDDLNEVFKADVPNL